LAIRHLVKQLESVPQEERAKHAPPDWLHGFIDDIAQLFEPFSGVARVGYECMDGDDGWEIALFLGEHEIVGGANDGQMHPVNFRFDLGSVQAKFDRIDGMFWNAFPNSHVCFEEQADLSFVTIEGVINEKIVRLQLHAAPPEAVEPAMRQHPDGRMEIV